MKSASVFILVKELSIAGGDETLEYYDKCVEGCELSDLISVMNVLHYLYAKNSSLTIHST